MGSVKSEEAWLAELEEIDARLAALEVRPAMPPSSRPDSLRRTLVAVERREIIAALKRVNGFKSKAARSLGVSRSKLYRRMEVLGLVAKDWRRLPLEAPASTSTSP